MMKKGLIILILFFTITINYGQTIRNAEQINASDTLEKTEILGNVEDYIRKETIGGKLDYNKLLEKENGDLFLYDGIIYNKKDFAIFLWGKKIKSIGISSIKKATSLWEEINKRKLTKPEMKALMKGIGN